MRSDDDNTREAIRRSVSASAAVEFAEHELVAEGEGRWLCRRPGTGLYAFRVIQAPGTVIVFGDVGNAIIVPGTQDTIGWLRKAIHSPSYLISKVTAGNDRMFFYRGDAAAWMAERIAEGDESAVAARKRLHPSFDRGAWYEAWDKAHDDLPDFDGPAPSMYWTVECLRWFVAAVDRRAVMSAAAGR